MGLFVSHVNDSGLTLVVTLVKHNGDEFRPGTGWQAAGTSAFADRKITLTGGTSDKARWYKTAEITGLGDDGYVWILVHNDGESDQVIGDPGQAYIWGGVEITPADVLAISHDATAADNAELMFDGTGYAGGTAKLGVDVVAISGDTTAANNAELMFDGTGYAGGTIKLGVDTVSISGDSVAADNLEAMFDGAGYAGGTIPLNVNVLQISGDATAADNCELFFDGTGYAGGTTKLNVNLFSASADTITASALAGDAVTEIAAAISALQFTRTGTAQAGGASTITLDASASVTDDAYNGLSIRIINGTGLGQVPRTISDYVGATKVATVGVAWTTQPDATSVFVIEPEASHELSADGFDNIVVEAGGTTLNARQAISIIAAAAAGDASGMGTTTGTIKAAGDSATTRITGTIDQDGNRSAVTITPPA